MPNTKTFKYLISANKYDKNDFNISLPEGDSSLGVQFGSVTQTSPSWVLTFVRWETRDLLRTPTKTPYAVRPPLIVENDCIQINVSDNKGVLTPSMSATLVQTDINYSTEIHPGDFVFVNILNWEEDSKKIIEKIEKSQPINEKDDGFKGFFKVQSVRKTISSNPNTGTKTVLVRIEGFAFTEFNNTIYFNPNLINLKVLANTGLYIADIAGAWSDLVSKSGKPYIQEIIKFLIKAFIGSGPITKNVKDDTGKINLLLSSNQHFILPRLVGQLLGTVKPDAKDNKQFVSVTSAKDIYLYLFGIQDYENTNSNDPSIAMNPSNLLNKNQKSGFLFTKNYCKGNSILKPEFWNSVTLWSILNQYTNSPLNELYTCFKLSSFGRVMPTVIFRQIPFTSEDFENQKFGVLDKISKKIKVTKFLSLPRWKIGSESIYSINIGKDEAARVNFVQFYAKSLMNANGIEIAGETASHNYVFDSKDVVRNGLKPIIVQNQFDDLPENLEKSSPIWARILGDALIGGHLKLNGTIECIGISDPITVGDNLEFDNVVYHIEQIVHSASINPLNGTKTFRTTISLSHGISVNSNEQGIKYSQMTYTDAYLERSADHSSDENYVSEQILPGVSESQDVLYRDNLDYPSYGEFSLEEPFSQPSTNKNKDNKGE